MISSLEKKRILFIAPNLRISNGVTSFLMSFYDCLIQNGYMIDFLLIKKIPSRFNSFVEHNGSRIYVYPETKSKFSIKNYKYVKELLGTNKYFIIHNNLTGMYAYWILLAADFFGVSSRIYHSHNPKENTSIKSILREEIFDRMCFKHSTDFMACTESAGKSVFGKRKFSVIPNGIDFEKYCFNYELRKGIRKKYGISDRLVIGTVCRQATQKNPFFIVDIIASLVSRNNKIVLLWAGSGPLVNQVKSYSEEKDVANNIIFVGDIDNINEVYSAMDIFLLPSLYEGLGIVFLEAQANGLYCFASTAVPKDTNIIGKVSYIDLSEDSDVWAERILKQLEYTTLESRDVDLKELQNCKSSVTNTRKIILDTYRSILERNKIK